MNGLFHYRHWSSLLLMLFVWNTDLSGRTSDCHVFAFTNRSPSVYRKDKTIQSAFITSAKSSIQDYGKQSKSTRRKSSSYLSRCSPTTIFPGRVSSSALSASSSSTTSPKEEGSLDVDALLKYVVALVVQVSLFYGLFTLMDNGVMQLKASASDGSTVPFLFKEDNAGVSFWVNCVFFYFMSLRSRIFNPLSNKRPDQRTFEVTGTDDAPAVETRNMPTWTPPGVVFPIMWILIIAPIRAYSSSLVYDVTQSYADVALLSLAAHLSIGDVWNTINNVEKRYGTAVVGLACVWLSKAFAAFQFYQVSPTAGQLLSVALIWLTIAWALVTRIWQLNPDPITGELESLYPVKKAGLSTEFDWFSKK